MAIIAPDIAIDLGTSNTQVYVKHRGIVLNEPTLLVVKEGKKRSVKAFGNDARLMLGRAMGEYTALRPMQGGLIEDLDMTELMLDYFVRKAIGSSRLVAPRGWIAIPSEISSVERGVIRQAAKKAGIRSNALHLIEKPFAAALGSGLPVFEPRGSMVVDIGGGSTEAAVISLGGIVVSKCIRVGGIAMDNAIGEYTKKKFNMLIGQKSAEDVKLDLGAALPSSDARHTAVRGRDLVTNLPMSTQLNANMVYYALQEPCKQILSTIHYVLERTPPELAGDIMRSGIYLTGGAAMLYGMDRYIASELDMPVRVSKEPMECTAMGLGHLSENAEWYDRMIKSTGQRENVS